MPVANAKGVENTLSGTNGVLSMAFKFFQDWLVIEIDKVAGDKNTHYMDCNCPRLERVRAYLVW